MRTNQRSLELLRESQQLIPGGVNSPVRAFRAVGGEPLFIERGRYAGGGELLTAPWGLASHPVAGTWLALDPPAALTMRLRAALTPMADPAHWGVSRLPRVLALRYRGPSAAEARALFIHAWMLARPSMLGREARPPRIWAT